MPGAGRLRERVTFQQRAADANGERTGAWGDRMTLRARYLFLRGSEGLMEDRLANRQPVVMIVRDSGKARQIEASWRAQDARTGRGYLVKAIAPNREDPRFLDVLVQTDV